MNMIKLLSNDTGATTGATALDWQKKDRAVDGLQSERTQKRQSTEFVTSGLEDINST